MMLTKTKLPKKTDTDNLRNFKVIGKILDMRDN